MSSSPVDFSHHAAVSIWKHHAQSVLFAAKLQRMALAELKPPAFDYKSIRINVWRNHALEPLLPYVELYFAYCGWQPDFRMGGYDDTLLFAGHEPADLELLWLDSERFLKNLSFAEWLPWLTGRIHTLRAVSRAPIVLATWCGDVAHAARLQAVADSLPAVYFADLEGVCNRAQIALLDPRSAAIAGTSISKSAQLSVARELGCHWLPAAVFPPLKAVAVDLDNTLHKGVLGEDGIQGVELTEGHRALQVFLKTLQQSGVFLALISRNELQDVQSLFRVRQDYPLRWDDFSAIEVSWGEKPAALKRVASALRIAVEAIVFVDDNPGELANVALRLPEAQTILAHDNPDLTLRTIQYYPGLWRWHGESEDAKRIADLRANEDRAALAESVSTQEEYFRSLQVSLTCRYNSQTQLNRLSDLCGKTNQFNLALRRFNHAEIANRMGRSDAAVASVQLKDRFSDSGVIAVLIAERRGDVLLVEELCISCRAMGRQLEDTIVLSALRHMPLFAGCNEVAFQVNHGQRNRPALDWLARLLQQDALPQPGSQVIAAERIRQFRPADSVIWTEE